MKNWGWFIAGLGIFLGMTVMGCGTETVPEEGPPQHVLDMWEIKHGETAGLNMWNCSKTTWEGVESPCYDCVPQPWAPKDISGQCGNSSLCAECCRGDCVYYCCTLIR